MPITSEEKTTAFILARLTSSRMPAKHFRHIGSKIMLAWIISRLRQCLEIDEIIITTVAEPENEPLKNYAREEGLACFWYKGEVDHVTTRLRRAAEWSDSDICLLISGDCPLIYAPAIDEMLRQFKADKEGDIFILDNICHKDLQPALYGVGIARKGAWQKADDLSDRPELKEHHFPVMGQCPELFKKVHGVVSADICFPPSRLFIDTYADLQFIRKLHDMLAAENKPFELPDVIHLLRQQPQLREINNHVHQRQLIEDIKKVLFVVDAGGKFGSGHIRRSMELGMQIVERLSWPVTFVVDDIDSMRLLRERGFHTVVSALSRPSRQISSMATTAYTANNNIHGLKADNYDLIIIDVAHRPISKNWQDALNTSAPVVVIDKAAPWTQKADLVIIPGVTCEVEKINNPPAVLAGKNYIILRREVRMARKNKEKKDIDITAYLPDPKRQKALHDVCRRHSLTCRIVAGGDENFPDLLSKSRYFIGNLGYSFYEALYLGAFPIAWPVSSAHADDALLFYGNLSLPSAIIGSYNIAKQQRSSALEDVILTCLADNKVTDTDNPIRTDGTPAIVKELQRAAYAGAERR